MINNIYLNILKFLNVIYLSIYLFLTHLLIVSSSPVSLPPSVLLFHVLPDELLSSQEKSSGMKDVIVSIDTSKDSDADSSKPSSKATSLQNSPATQKGQPASV